MNDAGKGIAGLTVGLSGAGGVRSAQPTAEGKFSFLGLDAGAYTVSTKPESYPMGYSLQNIPAAQLTVVPGNPAKAEITVKALRALSGKVVVYDPALARQVPLAGVTVTLKELSLQAKTSDTYIFRNLAAGRYTIAVKWLGKETSTTVIVPADPASIKDVDLNAGTK